MIIARKVYYKVLVLDIEVFHSSIVDERHFTSEHEANAFRKHINRTTDYVSVLVAI